jgi:hypothetical protein
MGNVPQRQVNAQHARTPHSSMPILSTSSNSGSRLAKINGVRHH